MRAKVRIRRSRFLAAFAAVGKSGNAAIARATELDPKSIYSALKGGPVSEKFQANTIEFLRKPEHLDRLDEVEIAPTLDSIFEVSKTAMAVA